MIKELEGNLKRHHIKPTAMRLLVLEYLMEKETAISLTDLYETFVKSDRTTLYRTLKAFKKNGLVHTIDDGTSVPKYALCTDACDIEEHNDAHIHFHCDNCGKTYCLPTFRIPGFKLPKNFSKKEVNLVVKGKCAACND